MGLSGGGSKIGGGVVVVMCGLKVSTAGRKNRTRNRNTKQGGNDGEEASRVGAGCAGWAELTRRGINNCAELIIANGN